MIYLLTSTDPYFLLFQPALTVRVILHGYFLGHCLWRGTSGGGRPTMADPCLGHSCTPDLFFFVGAFALLRCPKHLLKPHHIPIQHHFFFLLLRRSVSFRWCLCHHHHILLRHLSGVAIGETILHLTHLQGWVEKKSFRPSMVVTGSRHIHWVPAHASQFHFIHGRCPDVGVVCGGGGLAPCLGHGGARCTL